MIQRSFKCFKINLFSIYSNNRRGWFRIFGVGIKWKDINIHRLTFSERNNYTKYIIINNWCIGLLQKQL